MRVLVTGGSGLLGKLLIPLLSEYPRVKVSAPSHEELDITRLKRQYEYDLIIHAAAYTDVIQAEKDKKECAKVNVGGTLSLLELSYPTPFVYISTEYAKSPVNYYASTKAVGEILTSLWSENYLIIRTLFKPNPFPWDKAFIDQYTQGDYVDVIAPLIAHQIMKWDKCTSKTIYIGTGRKTMLALAQRTKPDVIPCSINDVEGVKIPKDYE